MLKMHDFIKKIYSIISSLKNNHEVNSLMDKYKKITKEKMDNLKN